MKRAEARCRYYVREEARRIGWDIQHPSRGGSFLEEQEVVDYFPELRRGLGATRPDFCAVTSGQRIQVVIECKNDFSKLESALEEAKGYADSINSVPGFDVKMAVGVAGNPDGLVQTRCLYRKRNDWTRLTSHRFEITQLPTIRELEIAIANDDGTTDVQLPDEREFFDAAIKISNILRLAKIEESVRPRVIGAIILALYQGSFGLHQEVVIENINTNVQAGIGSFNDLSPANRESLRQSLQLSTESKFLKTRIAEIVYQLERLNIRSIMRSGVDFLGQFYEAFLRYGCDAKSMGIVFTPRHITRYCADIVNVTAGMKVYDPTCGTGGFLVSAFDRMMQTAVTSKAKEEVKKSVFGCETNSTVWTLSILNMMFRGDGKSHIMFKSCFDNPRWDDGEFDRVLLNPPFSQEGEPETDFIDHSLKSLRVQGELALVVKTAIAVDDRLRNWRKQLIENHHVLAVISLPSDLFYPTGAPTVIMVISAHSPTQAGTFLARVKNDGYEISKKRRVPRDGSMLPRVLELFNEYRETGQISNADGIACVVPRELINQGDEICAERWLESEPFTRSNFDIQSREILRQISLAIASNPELVDELIDDYDELLGVAEVKGRPAEKATIEDWFEVSDGLTKNAKGIPAGSVPYISSSDAFNGIVGYLSPPEKEIIDYPVITVTGFGRAYLQPWRFCLRGGAGSAVRFLTPKFAMTSSELIWFASQINFQQWRIFYSRMASQSRLEKFELDPPPNNLPILSGLNRRLARFGRLIDSFVEPPADGEEFENALRELSNSWKAGRGHSSSAKQMAQHPAYRQIIAHGERALPFIMNELESNVDHWFLALSSITKANPVAAEDRGNLKKMAKAWKLWWKNRS